MTYNKTLKNIFNMTAYSQLACVSGAEETTSSLLLISQLKGMSQRRLKNELFISNALRKIRFLYENKHEKQRNVLTRKHWHTWYSWSSMENLSLRLRKTRGQYSLNLKWLGMFSLRKKQKSITYISKETNTHIAKWSLSFSEYRLEHGSLTCWRGGCPP